jgi:tetratricopeptide (TPR) repeat protein
LSLAAVGAAQPKISDCFKVYNLLKMDEEHYWADWGNACPYTIDSVYVMVKFTDRSRNHLGNGVWALHFVEPGVHRVMRLTAPRGVPTFERVELHKITIDAMEALVSEGPPSREWGPPPGQVADPGPTQVLAAPAPQLINDPAVSVTSTFTPHLEDSIPEAPTVSLSAEEHGKRGRELLKQRKFLDAIAEFSEALRERPDSSLNYNARGYAYYMTQDYSRALADLDEAIRLNPDYLNAYQNRSRSRKAAGDVAGSAADSKKAHELQHGGR